MWMMHLHINQKSDYDMMIMVWVEDGMGGKYAYMEKFKNHILGSQS